MEVWEVRVYKNFDDLIGSNQSLFKRILDDGHIDLMQACWSARDPEIHQLERRVILKEKELEIKLAELNDLKNTHQSILSELNLTSDENKKIKSDSKNIQKSILDLQKNCASLETFNQELLESQNSLQDELANFEKLNDMKEQEYVALKERFEREKIEMKIELKNAKEAINYANELEDIQQNNLKYIEELELKLNTTSSEYSKIKHSNKELLEKVESDRVKISDLEKLTEKNANNISNLKKKYATALDQLREYEKESKKLKDEFFSATQSNKQKQINLHQLQSTLEHKTKSLEDRETEVQRLANQLKNHEGFLADLKEEISIMEKVISESEENQASLEEYAEKLKVTAEREIILRKESDAKYEMIRTKMANLLTEKENLEAKLKGVEKTMSDIQRHFSPRTSKIKSQDRHLQLDN